MSCKSAGQNRSFTYIACFLWMLTVSGCFPVNVSEKKAAPELGTAPVAADWNPIVGPDLHVEMVYQAIAILRKHTHDLEFIEPDHFWRTALSRPDSTKTYHLHDVLTIESWQRLRAENIHFLVILKANALRKDTNDSLLTSMPFYMKDTWEEQREIVVISLVGDAPESELQMAKAKGKHTWVWFPGYFLLFVPLTTSVETEHSTQEGIAAHLNDYVLAKTQSRPVRIAIVSSE